MNWWPIRPVVQVKLNLVSPLLAVFKCLKLPTTMKTHLPSNLEDLTGPNSTQLNLLSGQDLEYFTDGTPITSNLAASEVTSRMGC